MELCDWSGEDCSVWMKRIGKHQKDPELFKEYAKYMKEHHIQGSALVQLKQKDLKQMGIHSVGHQKYIIEQLHNIVERQRFDAVTLFPGSPDQFVSTLLMKVIVTVTYLLFSGLVTSIVMVVVQYRVPDMQEYPPLPDVVLDSIPLIPWAFQVAEYILSTLVIILFIIICFHKHRLVILRRFLCIMATAFLMRSVTMYVTSLSVPGSHLKCETLDPDTPWEEKFSRAIEITSGMGLSINGVQTCGDYMFSGHTCVITLLNYCICEYSPSSYRGLHIFTSILNAFGMFFILAAHEHYTLDVIVAFYVASRLFLYYHEAVKSSIPLHSSLFPLLYYLEDQTEPVKNEYEFPGRILARIVYSLKTSLATKSKKQQ